MNAQEIIQHIKEAKKKTPVKAYINSKTKIDFPNAKVFGNDTSYLVIGDYEDIAPIIDKNKQIIADLHIENEARNSAIPLLDTKSINARIEFGAIIREQVTIKDHAVIMMGAIINIGCVIGENTMIDMGAVLGGRVEVGNDCHIGAGTVLAGVIEPASAQPVIIEDQVVIGANAVVIEGVRVGKGSVVAAGSIVLSDVPEHVMVAGCPAKIIKAVDQKTASKTGLEEDLRTL